MFLASRSSGLNSIEPALAKLTHWVRDLASRSRGALGRAAGDVLNSFTPAKSADDFTEGPGVAFC